MNKLNTQTRDEEIRELRATITSINEAVASWERRIQAGELDPEEISFELAKAGVDRATCEARIAELE